MKNNKSGQIAKKEQTEKNTQVVEFKKGVDNLLEKRQYFVTQVLPRLKKDQDYYEIKGKKSLSKGGAEKLASIFQYVATFERDDQTVELLKEVGGMVVFICNLAKDGSVAGQGRGADTLARNQNDPNKTIKMAQKRSYVDAVIRATGLSDIFTQDLEDMVEVDSAPERADKYYCERCAKRGRETPITEGVAKYSLERYGHKLCMECQQKAEDYLRNKKRIAAGKGSKKSII